MQTRLGLSLLSSESQPRTPDHPASAFQVLGAQAYSTTLTDSFSFSFCDCLHVLLLQVTERIVPDAMLMHK